MQCSAEQVIGRERASLKSGGACPPQRRAGGRARRVGGSNSVVESQPSKLLVAGSIPVSRSNLRSREFRASYGWQANLGPHETRLSARPPKREARRWIGKPTSGRTKRDFRPVHRSA